MTPRLIDLHLHTTASDGLDTPEHLVRHVAAAGVGVFAVTDHDTVAALAEVAAHATRCGLGWLPGIEITAVEDGRDVHVLGYGFDPAAEGLIDFLAGQRRSRLDRIREYGRRFAELGMGFDVTPLVEEARARAGRAVGRAHVARALLEAGHVRSVDEAFDQWLLPGRPCFVPRQGAPVSEVVARIGAAGGLASLAHPGLLGDDTLVTRLMGCGLHAIEAYHSEHDDLATRHYAAWGPRAGLALSGGSDFHGDASNRQRHVGGVALPPADYEALRARAVAVGSSYAWPATP